jgi:uncharacterized membrane protein YbaN (DUF454 family)
VANYRNGLGMPRRAKIVAIVLMLGFTTLALVTLDGTIVKVVIATAALIGALWVSLRVPTTERVLAAISESEHEN